MKNISSKLISFAEIDWNNTHGSLPFRMSNDYLFRAIMQHNNNVLKSLVCSLLYLDEKIVSSVLILNPIELGETIDSKNYILDIKVDLDSQMVINLELQVVNEHNWPERSLCYLCRSFDNLNRGDEYTSVRPAVQIGILDFTLFQENSEFYATYQLLNIKNHKLYSDKLRISVLELNQVSIATKEDRSYQLDCWAKFFKASTWEELYMIGKDKTIFQEAVSTVYQLSQEEKIRQQCEAREDYYRRVTAREILLQDKIREVEQLFDKLNQTSAERDQLSVKLNQTSAERNQLSDKLNQTSAERDQAFFEIQRLQHILAENGIDLETSE